MLAIADALEANVSKIRHENEADVDEAELAGFEKPLVSRLTLKPEKVTNKIICLTISCFDCLRLH